MAPASHMILVEQSGVKKKRHIIRCYKTHTQGLEHGGWSNPPDCVRCNRAHVALRWTPELYDFAKASSGLTPSTSRASMFVSRRRRKWNWLKIRVFNSPSHTALTWRSQHGDTSTGVALSSDITGLEQLQYGNQHPHFNDWISAR